MRRPCRPSPGEMPTNRITLRIAAERTLGRSLIRANLAAPIELAAQHPQAVVPAKPPPPPPTPLAACIPEEEFCALMSVFPASLTLA